VHAPPEQWSLEVQALPSLQARALFAWLQVPFVSHVSVVHGLPSSHAALQQKPPAQAPVAPFAKRQSLLTEQPLAPGPRPYETVSPGFAPSPCRVSVDRTTTCGPVSSLA